MEVLVLVQEFSSDVHWYVSLCLSHCVCLYRVGRVHCHLLSPVNLQPTHTTYVWLQDTGMRYDVYMASVPPMADGSCRVGGVVYMYMSSLQLQFPLMWAGSKSGYANEIYKVMTAE